MVSAPSLGRSEGQLPLLVRSDCVARLVSHIVFGFAPGVLKQSLYLEFKELWDPIAVEIVSDYIFGHRQNVVHAHIAKSISSFRCKHFSLNASEVAFNYFTNCIDILHVENDDTSPNQILDLLKWMLVSKPPMVILLICLSKKSIWAFSTGCNHIHSRGARNHILNQFSQLSRYRIQNCEVTRAILSDEIKFVHFVVFRRSSTIWPVVVKV